MGSNEEKIERVKRKQKEKKNSQKNFSQSQQIWLPQKNGGMKISYKNILCYDQITLQLSKKSYYFISNN